MKLMLGIIVTLSSSCLMANTFLYHDNQSKISTKKLVTRTYLKESKAENKYNTYNKIKKNCGEAYAGFWRTRNEKTIEKLLSLFVDDYESKQPLFPQANFGGKNSVTGIRGIDVVRKRYTSIFNMFPDFSIDVIYCHKRGNTVWAEEVWRAKYKEETGSWCFDHPARVSFELSSENKISKGTLFMRYIDKNDPNNYLLRCLN